MTLSGGLIAAVALVYMAILFAIAFYGDRNSASMSPRLRPWVATARTAATPTPPGPLIGAAPGSHAGKSSMAAVSSSRSIASTTLDAVDSA
jgi:hypothetical protein